MRWAKGREENCKPRKDWGVTWYRHKYANGHKEKRRENCSQETMKTEIRGVHNRVCIKRHIWIYTDSDNGKRKQNRDP